MTPRELAGQVEELLARCDSQRLGFYYPYPWDGPEHIDVQNLTFAVRSARGPLEARDILCQTTEPLILLSQVDDRELGLDLCARLARTRLHRLDAWGAVRSRFRAQQIDKRLTAHPAVAAYLLAQEPPEGYPPAAAGYLTEELAWTQVLRGLGLQSPPHDLEGWLSWLSDSPACQLETSVAELLHDWISRFVGELGARWFHLALQGHAGQVVALGLALGALCGSDPEQLVAVARLEARAGGRLSPVLVEEWSRRSQTWLASRGGAARSQHFEVAEQILAELQALPLARHSPWLPAGLEQRLEAFAIALRGQGDMGAAYRHLSDHQLLATVRRERVDLAARLAGWLARPHPEARSAGQAAELYRSELAFVDWARDRLYQGDPNLVLRDAYRDLCRQARERREVFNRQFAELLARGQAGLLPVESVLERVVGPLAKETPTLLLVLDGASWAVMHELLEDLSRQGWVELGPAGQSLDPVVTAFPSVTEFSRTSLLTGKLQGGDQAVEAREFPTRFQFNKPARVYHRSDLEQAVERLANRDYRLVAAVVNAVDDHLSRSDQLELRWTVELIRPVLDLLTAAQRSRRVVVLASDHGHLLESGTELRRADGGGDRWRPGQPEPGEIELSGPRVLAPGHRCLLPYTETVRYGMKKCGYHGGITPQECLAPLAILAPAGVEVAGYRALPRLSPLWWELDQLKQPGPRPGPVGQLSLFRDDAEFREIWSEIFQGDRAAALRDQEEALQSVLQVLLQVPQTSVSALSRELNRAESVLRTQLSDLAGLVDTSGEPCLVLGFDGQSVTLRVEQLRSRVRSTRLRWTDSEGRTHSHTLNLVLNDRERAAATALAKHRCLSEAALRKLVGGRRSVAPLVADLAQKLACIRIQEGASEGQVYYWEL